MTDTANIDELIERRAATPQQDGKEEVSVHSSSVERSVDDREVAQNGREILGSNDPGSIPAAPTTIAPHPEQRGQDDGTGDLALQTVEFDNRTTHSSGDVQPRLAPPKAPASEGECTYPDCLCGGQAPLKSKCPRPSPPDTDGLIERLDDLAKQYGLSAAAGKYPANLIMEAAAALDEMRRERDQLIWQDTDATIAKLRAAQSEISTLTKRVEELEKGLKGLIDGVVPEVNEKGAGGYLLARLTDARSLLEGKE